MLMLNISALKSLYLIDNWHILGIFLDVTKNLNFAICQFYYSVYTWLYVLHIFLRQYIGIVRILEIQIKLKHSTRTVVQTALKWRKKNHILSSTYTHTHADIPTHTANTKFHTAIELCSMRYVLTFPILFCFVL